MKNVTISESGGAFEATINAFGMFATRPLAETDYALCDEAKGITISTRSSTDGYNHHTVIVGQDYLALREHLSVAEIVDFFANNVLIEVYRYVSTNDTTAKYAKGVTKTGSMALTSFHSIFNTSTIEARATATKFHRGFGQVTNVTSGVPGALVDTILPEGSYNKKVHFVPSARGGGFTGIVTTPMNISYKTYIDNYLSQMLSNSESGASDHITAKVDEMRAIISAKGLLDASLPVSIPFYRFAQTNQNPIRHNPIKSKDMSAWYVGMPQSDGYLADQFTETRPIGGIFNEVTIDGHDFFLTRTNSGRFSASGSEESLKAPISYGNAFEKAPVDIAKYATNYATATTRWSGFPMAIIPADGLWAGHISQIMGPASVGSMLNCDVPSPVVYDTDLETTFASGVYNGADIFADISIATTGDLGALTYDPVDWMNDYAALMDHKDAEDPAPTLTDDGSIDIGATQTDLEALTDTDEKNFGRFHVILSTSCVDADYIRTMMGLAISNNYSTANMDKLYPHLSALTADLNS